MSAAQPPLIQLLLDRGLLTPDQLRIAGYEQQKRNVPLIRILLALGFVSEAALRDAQSDTLGQESIDLSHATVQADALALIDRDTARSCRVMPLAVQGGDEPSAVWLISLAVADPHDLPLFDRLAAQIQAHSGHRCRFDLRIAAASDIELAIDRHYGHSLSIDDLLYELENGQRGAALAKGQDVSHAPTVRLINALLTDAVREGASDIHFEPEAGFLRIRYRIDGLLQPVRVLHACCWPGMAVRLKVLANMNIAETRAPQDGRISLNIGGRPIDFRVASQPTLHGENLVLRVLDRRKGIVPLAQLGLNTAHLQRLEQLIARPEGMVLVSGPTGCGKTTTLYSLLQHIHHQGIHIMTLEDPVEYPMPFLRQTSVGEAVKMDFASGIRAMLRQDPDVILVGEIRDSETAHMAFRAAMTGHQVLSTLHSNSAVAAITRLLDLGLAPDILAANLSGVIGQRLLRRLCPHCKCRDQLDDTRRARLGGFAALLADDAPLWTAKGCQACRMQGYRGRLAAMELFVVNSALEDLIARRAGRQTLEQAAQDEGWVPLAVDGLLHVLAGETSLAEVLRVVDFSRQSALASLAALSATLPIP